MNGTRKSAYYVYIKYLFNFGYSFVDVIYLFVYLFRKDLTDT